MNINKLSVAGTIESSDIMVEITPSEKTGINIELDSVVEKQFGDDIRKTIEQTLINLKVESANVKATDKGALDCVIISRVMTAVYRASGDTDFKWEEAK